MMRLDWTPSGYMFVEVDEEKPVPNKNAERPDVEMVVGSPASSHRDLPIPLIGAGFIMVLVFMAGIVIGMGIM